MKFERQQKATETLNKFLRVHAYKKPLPEGTMTTIPETCLSRGDFLYTTSPYVIAFQIAVITDKFVYLEKMTTTLIPTVPERYDCEMFNIGEGKNEFIKIANKCSEKFEGFTICWGVNVKRIEKDDTIVRVDYI